MKALLRYRIMAYVVGIGLIILVFVGVPLQVAGHPAVANVVGVVHGILYVVYLLAAYGLYRKAHFTLLQLVAMVAAGFVPFLAFYVERRTTRRISRDLAALKSPVRTDAGPGTATDPVVPVVTPPEP